jgi:hypothetical protein
MKVTDRIEGCYDAHEVPFGKVYVWRPGRVMIECDCGEGLILTSSATICGCGANYAATLQETLVAKRLKDEDLHPWRYPKDLEDAKCLTGRAFFDEID